MYAPFGGSLQQAKSTTSTLRCLRHGRAFRSSSIRSITTRSDSQFSGRVAPANRCSGNFLCAHAQKYNGYTFVFDIGGSFEENARYFGGSVLRLTLQEQSFSINPFSLADTPDNRKFLLNFLKLLMGIGVSWSHIEENQLAELIAGLYRQYAGTPLCGCKRSTRCFRRI